jgi:hypothetical protein
MVTGHNLFLCRRLESFIQGLKCLRELMLDGEKIDLQDWTLSACHADTIELLFVGCGAGLAHRQWLLAADEETITMLQSFTALRHLSLCFTGRHVVYPDGSNSLHRSLTPKLIS